MLTLSFVFFTLLSLSWFFAILTHRRLEETLPFSFFFIILSAYLLAVMGFLAYLAPLLFIASTSALSFILFVYVSRPADRSSIRASWFSVSVLLFLLLSLFVILYNRGRLFTLWDEFSHWGLVAKNTFYLDGFAIGERANTVFQDYPPAMVLLQYFFTSLDQTFFEAHVLQANAVFSITLLISMFSGLRMKWARPFFILVSMILVIWFYPSHFKQLYVDGMLAILFAYMMVRIVDPRPWDLFRWIEIASVGAVLTLTKASGFFLALLALCIVLLMFSKDKKIPFFVSLSVILSAKFSWSSIVSGLGKHFDVSAIRLSDILDFFLLKAPSYRYDTLRNFLSSLIFEPMVFFTKKLGFAGIGVSYLLFILILIFLIQRYIRSKNLIRISRFLCFFFILYAFSLLFMYMFTFSEYESVRLASFDRYLSTFVLAFALLFLYWAAALTAPFLDSLFTKLASNKYILFPLVAVFLVASILLSNRILGFMNGWRSTISQRAPYAGIDFYQSVFEEGDTVYVIAQHTNGYPYWVVRYNLTPVKTQNGFGSWSLGEAYDASDAWHREITPEAWAKELAEEFTYVYLQEVDERFMDEFGSLFESKEKITRSTLYEVKVSGADVILEAVVVLLDAKR
ncbi:MAG TPA: hypothetical protein DCQ90_06695 [Erysipelotrichaceae bacterium]|nr:hypothetical protein [Erysipelotrichaceae bacterium]